VSDGISAFHWISRPVGRNWLAAAVVAALALLFLPMVIWKAVALGQGDAQVFFRAGWAIWTGYPLYEITDRHGWTYQYPPTFALFMGIFADPLAGYPQTAWALPFAVSIVVWYLVGASCLVLSLHVWANALQRYRPFQSGGGILPGSWALQLGPLLALLPFVGTGLVRGQMSPVLLLLMVAFLVFYVEKRLAFASFVLALAIAFKIFPAVLAILPLLRRDWKFLAWTAAWCVVLLVGLPAICLGPAATVDLYRAMWTEHLAGLVSGAMSPSLANEISPGGYSRIGVGSVVARIAAGEGFNSAPIPGWASAVQYVFDAALLATLVALGNGGFWNFRGPQPVAAYPLLVAGAVLLAAIPLMIPFGKPQDITYAVPLVAVLTIEAWRRAGRPIVTPMMVGWTCIAWLSLIALETPWNWLKVVGPMTWLLLLLGPASLSLVRRLSLASRGAAAGVARVSQAIPPNLMTF
jgi:hypothetical protein